MHGSQTFDQQIEDLEIQETLKRIRHKIMIMSNKGGVGKSTIAANIADGLSQNSKVGLFDVDLHGPSQKKIFNIKGRHAVNGKQKIIPFKKNNGNLKIITISPFCPS